MRFNCGASKETKFRMQRKAAVANAQELRQWHKMFAILPVRIEDYHCRCLQFVMRRFPNARYDDFRHRMGSYPINLKEPEYKLCE